MALGDVTFFDSSMHANISFYPLRAAINMGSQPSIGIEQKIWLALKSRIETI